MLQPGRIDLVGDHGDVEQGGGHALALDDARLLQVEAAGAGVDHGLAVVDRDVAVPLLVVIGQLPP